MASRVRFTISFRLPAVQYRNWNAMRSASVRAKIIFRVGMDRILITRTFLLLYEPVLHKMSSLENKPVLHRGRTRSKIKVKLCWIVTFVFSFFSRTLFILFTATVCHLYATLPLN